MYKEVNNYSVWDYSFLFPIEPGMHEINIDCDSLGGAGTLYPQMDISQGIACAGTGYTITTQFTIYETGSLILEDYINNAEVSFGTITIDTVETIEENTIFKNYDNLLDFYIVEGVILVLLIIFISFKKIFYNR